MDISTSICSLTKLISAITSVATYSLVSAICNGTVFCHEITLVAFSAVCFPSRKHANHRHFLITCLLIDILILVISAYVDYFLYPLAFSSKELFQEFGAAGQLCMCIYAAHVASGSAAKDDALQTALLNGMMVLSP